MEGKINNRLVHDLQKIILLLLVISVTAGAITLEAVFITCIFELFTRELNLMITLAVPH